VLCLGGDVDTNAAIVGAALGALHGASAIPRRLAAPVVVRDVGSPGRGPRPAHLQGAAIEPLVRELWEDATGPAQAEGGSDSSQSGSSSSSGSRGGATGQT
jgi:hypothetical protein